MRLSGMLDIIVRQKGHCGANKRSIQSLQTLLFLQHDSSKKSSF
jgi:hypothetical protein